MKGSIVRSLQEMIELHHGKNHWENILKRAGLPANHKFFAHHDVEDQTVHEVIEHTTKELNISMSQAGDAFGDYWMNNYAPKAYFAFFVKKNSAKDFILELNRIHEKITQRIENAAPPKFEYQDEEENTVIMTYNSPRGLQEIWMLKGTATYFNETIDIERLEESKVKLTFS